MGFISFFIILTILLIISFYFRFKNQKYRLTNVVVISSLLYAILGFYKPIAVLLFTIVLIFMVVEVYIIYKFKDFNEGIIEAILNTNKEEVIEILNKNKLNIFISILFVGIINYIAFSYMETNILYGFISIIPFFITFFAAQFRLFRIDWKLKQYAKNGDAFNVINAIDRLDKNVISSIRVKYPLFFGNFFYLLNYRSGYDFDFNKKRCLPNFVVDQAEPKVKNIILVLGESANPDRFGIYGYTKFNTTPRLGGMTCCKVINNVHSLSNMTRTALPFLIAFPQVQDFGKAYTYKNIIDIANEKNINTIWIGNQAIESLFTSSYGPIVKSANKVFSRDYNSTGENFSPKDDFDLLPVIDLHFKDYGKNSPNLSNLFIIHTVGSHAPYSLRSDDIDRAALQGADDYDLSVHHTDRFLYELTSLADSHLADYLVIYTSDHGEVLVDEGGGLEHGLTFGGYQQYKVPFIILNKSSYELDCDRYKKNNGNYSNDMAAFFVMEAMGIDIQCNYIMQYKEEDKILHSDYMVYNYDDLPQPSMRK